MDSVYVTFFGHFQIKTEQGTRIDENDLPIKIKILLAYMIFYRNRYISVEEYANAIWNDKQVEYTYESLKNLVYRTRTVLNSMAGSQRYIISDRGSYRWSPQIPTICDIDLFEQKLQEAQEKDPLECWEAALNLYHLGFNGFKLNEFWCVPIRIYYHDKYLNLLKEYLRLQVQKGKYQEALSMVRQGLENDPFHEPLHEWMMKILNELGYGTLLEEHYQRTRGLFLSRKEWTEAVSLEQAYGQLRKLGEKSERDQLMEIWNKSRKETGGFWAGQNSFWKVADYLCRLQKRYQWKIIGAVFHIFKKRIGSEDLKEIGDCIQKSLNQLDIMYQSNINQWLVLQLCGEKEDMIQTANRAIDRIQNLGHAKDVEISYSVFEIPYRNV